MFSLERWRPGHLLAAWGAYWLALAGVTLGPVLAHVLPLIGDPTSHGTVSVSMVDARLAIHVANATGAFAVSASLLPLAVAIAAPPLALWATWLVRTRRAPVELRAAPEADELPPPHVDVPQRPPADRAASRPGMPGPPPGARPPR